MRWILLTFVLLAGCGEEEEARLRGSLSTVCDLGFTSIRARLLSTSLSVEYLRADGLAVVRVVVKTTDPDLVGPGDIDLARRGEVTGRCEIPPLLTGTLRLTEYAPQDGARVAGTVVASFDGSGGEVLLYGEFEATLEDVR